MIFVQNLQKVTRHSQSYAAKNFASVSGKKGSYRTRSYESGGY
jgi:hypothetical protein